MWEVAGLSLVLGWSVENSSVILTDALSLPTRLANLGDVWDATLLLKAKENVA